MGAAAPLAGGGGILKGTAPAQVPLSGFFRPFLCRSKKWARRRRRGRPAKSRRKRRIRRNPKLLSAAVGTPHPPLRGTFPQGKARATQWGLPVKLTGRPLTLESISLVLPQTETQRESYISERTFRRNHRAFALAQMRRIPANKDVSPASSPRPFPGPRARRAYCRRGDGGSPARSPAWRR